MFLCMYDLSEECDGKRTDCTDCILDKITAEIEQIEINGHIRDVECFKAGVNVALNIVKKYKMERIEP